VKVHIAADSYNMALKLSTDQSGNWGYLSNFKTQGPYMKAISISLDNNENGFWYSNGELFASNFFVYSDQRLKTKVIDIDNPMDKIMKLRGVYYHYQPNSVLTQYRLSFSDTSRQIGFLAQELRTVVPEVVDSSSNGTLAVNYPQLIALLTAGIQEQQGEINNLKTQLQLCCEKAQINGKKDTLINLGKMSFSNAKEQFVLFQNQPNPFNETTLINYVTPLEAINVSILFFNMNGELIRSFVNIPNGKQSIQINGADLKPGMYLYSLIANGNEIDTKRMILTK
jgi:hypothetical protein